jgi:hypothetical protein
MHFKELAMVTKNKIETRVYNSLILVVAMILLVFGCTASHRPTNPTETEPLPVYRAGTTFVYSNGTWERVMANAPGMVTWKNNRGYISSGSPDFTYRRASWQTRSRKGSRTFGPREDIHIKRKESLWPLKIGNQASFTETGSWIDKKDGSVHRYTTHWSCEVTGTEKVAVPAGEFDTWKITCSRYNSARKTRNPAREVKTWYYAPKIGHYVLVNSQFFYNRPSRRLELIAVLPPRDDLSAKVQKAMDSSFQKAMELEISGSSSRWEVPGRSISGGTTPQGTFRLEDGTFCRRYVQELILPDDHQAYHGMGCRDSKGKWYIPRR